MAPNDKFLLKTITGYCEDIEAAIKRFNLSEAVIEKDSDMRALLAFFVQQIGETAGRLSSDFTTTHPEIEWKAIIGFRHHIVHAYGKIIPAILWDTTVDDIPKLHDFCKTLI